MPINQKSYSVRQRARHKRYTQETIWRVKESHVRHMTRHFQAVHVLVPLHPRRRHDDRKSFKMQYIIQWLNWDNSCGRRKKVCWWFWNGAYPCGSLNRCPPCLLLSYCEDQQIKTYTDRPVMLPIQTLQSCFNRRLSSASLYHDVIMLV